MERYELSRMARFSAIVTGLALGEIVFRVVMGRW